MEVNVKDPFVGLSIVQGLPGQGDGISWPMNVIYSALVKIGNHMLVNSFFKSLGW